MTITEDQLGQARQAWGDGLIAIAKDFEQAGIEQAKQTASAVLDSAYGYDLGPVLFKPTLSGGPKTFRTTKKGALSYFVGHDPDFPKDTGFGIKGWRSYASETAASFIQGDVAMWMGWFSVTDNNGHVTKVDKSFGYRLDVTGKLRIVLHHSSLPYEG